MGLIKFNEVIVRVTKTKQGIVESTDHARYRQPIDKGKSYFRSEEHAHRLGEIIADVILQGVIEE